MTARSQVTCTAPKGPLLSSATVESLDCGGSGRVLHVGTETLVDAMGCRPDALRDVDLLRMLCEQILTQLDLRAIGPGVWHSFPPPGGVTGLYLLSESHLAC